MNRQQISTLLQSIPTEDKSAILRKLQTNCRFSVDGFSSKLNLAPTNMIVTSVLRKVSTTKYFLSSIAQLNLNVEEMDKEGNLLVDDVLALCSKENWFSVMAYLLHRFDAVPDGFVERYNEQKNTTVLVEARQGQDFDSFEKQEQLLKDETKRLTKATMELDKQKKLIESLKKTIERWKQQVGEYQEQIRKLEQEKNDKNQELEIMRLKSESVATNAQDERKYFEQEIRSLTLQNERMSQELENISTRNAQKILVISTVKYPFGDKRNLEIYYFPPEAIGDSTCFDTYAHLIIVKSDVPYSEYCRIKRKAGKLLMIAKSPDELEKYLKNLEDNIYGYSKN